MVREEKTVYIDESTTLEPDISIVADKNYFDAYPEDRSKAYPRPQDVYLAIEVANTHTETATKKKRLIYAQAGIAQYWVYDLQRQTFRVYNNLSDGEYTETIRSQETVTLLGLKIPIEDLLELAFGSR